jgi:FtsH-binding integral membrane protein
MQHSSALPVAWVFLRILILLNWLSGAAIFALLSATVFAEQWTMTALGITPESGIPAMLTGLRAIAVLGLAAIPINHVILARLLGIVETVRGGDPFVAANALRLRVIAWSLLALQLLGIVIGAIGTAISTPANPVDIESGFSPGGWLAVLLAFILARIFAEGARMRDDLEGTV